MRAVPGAAVDWPGSVAGAALLALVLVLAVVAARLLAGARWQRPARRSRWAWHCWSPRPSPGWPPDGWVLVACDVGQGDALVLAGAPGTAVVVDAGPDPPAIDRCLRRLGVDRVPIVLLTHLHADHVEGLPGCCGVARWGRSRRTDTTSRWRAPDRSRARHAGLWRGGDVGQGGVDVRRGATSAPSASQSRGSSGRRRASRGFPVLPAPADRLRQPRLQHIAWRA